MSNISTESVERVVTVPFDEHMRSMYITYALDVIRSRALPSVYDGLKPVHRHILYAMHGLGLHPSSAYKKCARSVGETMGKYHPHGDASIYDALVVMAQDFKLRYPMIDGHGNFGSVDGDPAAAMRYTESRLSKYGELMLTDIDKNTVDLIPNYDESEREPEVMPGLFPALLCNGSSGIAVGMGADFVPHCAKDIYRALDLILEKALNDEETSDDEVIKIIQAPDFPTGGVIINQPDIWKAYREGTGRCIVRSKYSFERYGRSNDKDAIVITELPYGVNKAKLVFRIGQLAADNEDFDAIADVRDESDRTGMRIVIELKKDAQTNIMINRLLKATDLQKSISMHHNAIVDGHPQMSMSLKDMLDKFLEHTVDVLQRKAQYEHDRLAARDKILIALLKALEDPDLTISYLKTRSRAEALSNIKEAFSFDDEQAAAVVNMHFYSLNDEDKEKLEDEHKRVDNEVKRYDNILSSEKALLTYAREELQAVADKYFSKDKRKTEISTESDDRDTIPDMDVVIAYTHNGYIKSVKLDEYNTQARNGKGNSFKTKEDDFVESIHTLSTHDDIVLITDLGKAYVLPAYKVPTVSKSSIGKPLYNYVQLEPNEKVINLLVVTGDDREADKTILLVSRNGVGKRMSIDSLPHLRVGAKIITCTEDDSLVSATLVEDTNEIAVISAMGQLLRFPVDKVRVMGRGAAGVKIMTLKKESDKVVSAFTIGEGMDMLQVMDTGNAKRVSAKNIPTKVNRGSAGVRCLGAAEKSGNVVAAGIIGLHDDCMVVTQQGKIIRIAAKDISMMGRCTNGVGLIRLDDGDKIASVAIIDGGEEQTEEENA